MSKSLLSLFVAAGVAAFVYSRMGPRLGYGNRQNVWMLVGISFVLIFIVIFTLLTFVIHL